MKNIAPLYLLLVLAVVMDDMLRSVHLSLLVIVVDNDGDKLVVHQLHQHQQKCFLFQQRLN